MARKPRGFFKASDWELEDAEEESVDIVVNRSPKAFVIEDGRLVGHDFRRAWNTMLDAQRTHHRRAVDRRGVHPGRRRHSRHRAGERLPLDRSATSASSSTSGTCRRSTRSPSSRPAPGVFFGGDAAFGPKNIIWAVEHGHQAAISIHKHCQGEPITERPPPGVNLQSRKMGMHEWSLFQRLRRRSSGG